MILPTAEDVLRTIETTFETVIRPTLTESTERSAAATVSHLLRHARLRIEREGQILYDDIAALSALLPDMRRFLLGIGEAEAAAGIDAALKMPAASAGTYPSLALTGAQAAALRSALEAGLSRLQELRAHHGEDPSYRDLRAAIRTYLAEHVRREAELIEPAFVGRGPRR